jgi:group I intron endonuclease
MSKELDNSEFGYIYIFINNVNGTKYIGQTWTITKRIKEHFRGYGYARLLKDALDEFGNNNFTVKQLYKTTNQVILDNVEKHLIKVFNCRYPFGYNLASGGLHGKHHEETKKLIGSYHKNKIVTSSIKINIFLIEEYDAEPNNIQYSFGRKIIINDELGNELKFNSIKEAENILNLNRGIIDSLVRGIYKKSKYVLNGKPIIFTAKYLD